MDGSSGLEDFACRANFSKCFEIRSCPVTSREVAQPPDSQVLIERCDLSQLPGIDSRRDVFYHLSDAGNAGGLMEVPNAIPEIISTPATLAYPSEVRDLVEPCRLVHFLESAGSLIDELETMPPDLERTELARNDDLEDHCRLMGGAVERGSTQQRDSVVDLLMLHQRADPAYGPGSDHQVLRTQDEIELVAQVHQLVLFHQPMGCGCECGLRRTQVAACLFTGERGAAHCQLLIEIGFEADAIPQSYTINLR